MRPRSAGDERTGRLTSTISFARRAEIAKCLSSLLRALMASETRTFSPLIAGPAVLRSSALMAPNPFSCSETEPFLPRVATRTASMEASSPAFSISAMMACSRFCRSLISIFRSVALWRHWVAPNRGFLYRVFRLLLHEGDDEMQESRASRADAGSQLVKMYALREAPVY